MPAFHFLLVPSLLLTCDELGPSHYIHVSSMWVHRPVKWSQKGCRLKGGRSDTDIFASAFRLGWFDIVKGRQQPFGARHNNTPSAQNRRRGHTYKPASGLYVGNESPIIQALSPPLPEHDLPYLDVGCELLLCWGDKPRPADDGLQRRVHVGCRVDGHRQELRLEGWRLLCGKALRDVVSGSTSALRRVEGH